MRSQLVWQILKCCVGFVAAMAAVGGTTDVARAVQVARYTFDDSTANDSSGHNLNGTLLGNAAIVTDPIRGKVLSLTGSGGKVDLGNPAGLNVIGEFTSAAWVNPASLPQTQSSAGILQRGHQSGPSREFAMRIGTNGTTYEFGTWSPNQFASLTVPAADLNTWVHIAGTMTEETPGMFTYRLYRNATLVNTVGPYTNGMWGDFTVGWAIGARGGQAATTFERVFNGRIDDVQIYDDALDQTGIMQAMLGDLSSSVLALQIDPIDGDVQLKNTTTNPITLNSYRITSATNALSAANWNPVANGNELQAQFPLGDGTGNGWEMAQSPSNGELVEWYLNGNSTLNANQTLYLGKAFNAAGMHDVALHYTTADLTVTTGSVEYVAVAAPGVAGDYNNDGTVDAADYVIWRESVGTPSSLPNDPFGGTVGDNQYNQWRANFGKTAGSGAGLDVAAVPEPASLGLLVVATIIGAARRQKY
jgi:concanavalin A-like lectin/glucanase superfamily protein